MSDDGIIYNNDTYSIYLSVPEKKDVPVVVILPGGAYYKLSVRYEGSEVAAWLNQQGIGAAVLHYRMPNHHPEWPQEDIARAVTYLRNNALSLGIHPEKVGVMGFSAGGHAVAMALTRELPVQFAILFYPVISMDSAITHKVTHDWLLPANADTTMEQTWSADLHARQDMPRTLLVACEDDTSVPVVHTKIFYHALQQVGVSCEMHVLPHGGHGWGFSPAMPEPENVYRWLKTFLPIE